MCISHRLTKRGGEERERERREREERERERKKEIELLRLLPTAHLFLSLLYEQFTQKPVTSQSYTGKRINRETRKRSLPDPRTQQHSIDAALSGKRVFASGSRNTIIFSFFFPRIPHVAVQVCSMYVVCPSHLRLSRLPSNDRTGYIYIYTCA